MLESQISILSSLPENPALKDFGGLVGIATNEIFDLQTRIEATKKVTNLLTVEQNKNLDQNSLGVFLKFASKINQDPNSSEQLRTTLSDALSPFLLDALVIRSSIDQWGLEASQGLLEAYRSYMTINKIYGPEKAKEFKRKYAREMIDDKNFDLTCEFATLEEGRNGRTIINLGASGTEVAQDGVKLTYLDTTESLGIDGYMEPYYRFRYGVRGDEKKGFASYKKILAELVRREGGQYDAGLDIPCLGGTFDEDGKLRIHRAKPNVSSQLLPAVGTAVALRQNAIETEGIRFNEPRRTDALREVKIENLLDTMLVAFGDGSWINFPVALEFAALYKAPIIFLCLNNKVAIGTTYDEIQTTPIADKGGATRTPGIRIESTDADGIIAATRFATLRAALDAGPTIIEVMAERPVTHSTGGHANQLVAELIRNTQQSLDAYTNDPKIKAFLKEGIFAPADKDTTFALKERILRFLEDPQLAPQVRDKLGEIASRIINPMEVVLAKWQEEGIITPEQIKDWDQEAKSAMRALWEEVKQGALPNPDVVGKNIRVEGPTIKTNGTQNGKVLGDENSILVKSSPEVLTESGAKAKSSLIKEVMLQDPGVIGMGIDTNVGYEVKRVKTGNGFEYTTSHKGDYFHGWDEVHPAIGHLPGRLYNGPIGENALAQFALGLVTQPSYKIKADLERQIAILNGESPPFDPHKHVRRALVDFEYGDYGIQSFEGLWIHVGTHQNTNGQIIMPAVFLFPCAMVDGGGGMHSQSVEGSLNTLPEGLDLFTVSSPSILRNLLNYLLRFGNNPAALVLDRKLYKTTEAWEKGTGFFQPGKDLVIQDGSDLQIITWGPATPSVRASVKRLEERFGKGISIGVLEKISWRPSDYTDLEEFLSNGDGPIAIVTEEFKKKSIGNLLVADLIDDPRFNELREGRQIKRFATLDVSHPYCDKILMRGIRAFDEPTPNLTYEQDRLAQNLARLINKTQAFIS